MKDSSSNPLVAERTLMEDVIQSDPIQNIIIPKAIKPTQTDWNKYINSLFGSAVSILELKNTLVIKQGGERITKEERARKVEKFLIKRRRRNGIKKVRYQHRQLVADRRMRYKGRFVNIDEAKELIIKGEEVTANDRLILDKLIEELNKENLLEKYYETLRNKKVFKTVRNCGEKMNKRKQSISTIGGTNPGTSPLIQVMKDQIEKPTEREKESSVPILNL